jgi:hypothetical protein
MSLKIPGLEFDDDFHRSRKHEIKKARKLGSKKIRADSFVLTRKPKFSILARKGSRDL